MKVKHDSSRRSKARVGTTALMPSSSVTLTHFLTASYSLSLSTAHSIPHQLLVISTLSHNSSTILADLTPAHTHTHISRTTVTQQPIYIQHPRTPTQSKSITDTLHTPTHLSQPSTTSHLSPHKEWVYDLRQSGAERRWGRHTSCDCPTLRPTPDGL